MTTGAFECVPIHDVRLDQHSIAQIERMKKLGQTPRLINALLGGNIFLSIFAGKSAPGPSTGAGYLLTITQTDWEGYAVAMSGMPVAYRRQVEKEAAALYLNYDQDGNYKLSNFWKGIAYGCRY